MEILIHGDLVGYFTDRIIARLPGGDPSVVLYLASVLVQNWAPPLEPLGLKLLQAATRPEVKAVADAAMLWCGPWRKNLTRRAVGRDYYQNIASQA